MTLKLLRYAAEEQHRWQRYGALHVGVGVVICTVTSLKQRPRLFVEFDRTRQVLGSAMVDSRVDSMRRAIA